MICFISFEKEEMTMRRITVPVAVLSSALLLGLCLASGEQPQGKPTDKAPKAAPAETRFLAFQIFTFSHEVFGGSKTPTKKELLDTIQDIKKRIGTAGDRQTKLGIVLGPLVFDQTDAEVSALIELGFTLALENDVAIGFHIDDSMFWSKRKDMLKDATNVEALDWNGTACTARLLEWGPEPTKAPPQMCFNSPAVQREVRARAAVIGQAIQAGLKRLQERDRPELFAAAIAGWETMIGQDFQTKKQCGYRALLNRGFAADRPPADLDAECVKVVQEFIGLWTKGLADAGVPAEKIYAHTAFLSRRMFEAGDSKVTYARRNHFAPPSAAFGKHHRPGFSTYPQPGLFDDIYAELARDPQKGWASCEGTNLQLGSKAGQSGMTMETYLARMFHHGATLVNIFAWGFGGKAYEGNDFRVATEGPEALAAYRKFLKGEQLAEAKETSSFMERLPPKIRKIQKDLPAWIQKEGSQEKADQATALMRKLDEHLKAKDFPKAEEAADAILKMMGVKP
jgi:hypothetical protein